MAKISQSKLNKVKELYYTKKFSMKAIGNELGVSLDCVAYFMRKNNLKRRTLKEEQKLRFENKKPSFKVKKDNKNTLELKVIGAMLYWGEGYKGDSKNPSKLIDFTNSDVDMVLLFLKFLRNTYALDERKFRVLLYCYSNQNISDIIDFWSDCTEIPKSQFTKPYIRKDFKIGSRQMKYGLVHIRYNDKKLLLEIKEMIDSYRKKYLRRSYSGYYT